MQELNLLHKGKSHKKTLNSNFKENLYGYLFVLIPVLGFFLFTAWALGYSVFMSFTNFNAIKGTFKYVGFANYIEIFKEENFRDATLNTILMLLSIPIGAFLGLLLAIYLKKLAKGRTLLTIIYYLPAVTSSLAIMIVFRDLFRNGEMGLINSILGVELNWLSNDPWLIKIAIIIKNIWAGIGGSMILYLAGVNNIPESYYEVARVQGATRWQQFIDITLPMTNNTSFYLIVTGVIGGLQSYADSRVMGGGLPGARTIVYYIWNYGINQANYGWASAASVLLSIVILIITVILFSKSNVFKDVRK